MPVEPLHCPKCNKDVDQAVTHLDDCNQPTCTHPDCKSFFGWYFADGLVDNNPFSYCFDCFEKENLVLNEISVRLGWTRIKVVKRFKGRNAKNPNKVI